MAEVFDMDNLDALRPHVCEYCGGRYTRQEHLNRHVASKHEMVKKFACEFCDKRFTRSDVLKRHVDMHKKGLAAEDDVVIMAALEAPDAKAKLPRVGKACDECSRLKLRCSGGDQCERCIRLTMPCTFQRPWLSRAPRPDRSSVRVVAKRPRVSRTRRKSPELDLDDPNDEDTVAAVAAALGYPNLNLSSSSKALENATVADELLNWGGRSQVPVDPALGESVGRHLDDHGAFGFGQPSV